MLKYEFSYGSRNAALNRRPHASPLYNQKTNVSSTNSTSSTGSSVLPLTNLFATLPAIFRRNDEPAAPKQPTKRKTEADELDLDYRGKSIDGKVSQDKYTAYSLSEPQRKTLKTIHNSSIHQNPVSFSSRNSSNQFAPNIPTSSKLNPPSAKSGSGTSRGTESATSAAPSSSSSSFAKDKDKDLIAASGRNRSTSTGSNGSSTNASILSNKNSSAPINKPLNSDSLAALKSKYGSSVVIQQRPSSASSSSSSNFKRPSSGLSSMFPTVLTSRERENSFNLKEKEKAASTGKLVCDKCDGKHPTDSCPYYKKARENHPDAQRGKQMGGTSLLPGAYVTSARVIRQPGDGSCLFHSMSYGLGQGYSAHRLRNEICAFIMNNPKLKISDTPLCDWVRWDSNSTVSDYCRRMSRGGWGGGIEMAALSQMKQVNVHVYERKGNGYKRISAFDYHISPEKRPTIRVIYQGGVHYDAIVL